MAPTETPADEDLFLATLPLDIAGADYYALIAWVRSLGLPETGSAEELRQRLYRHYQVQAPPPPEASARTITIQSADRTSYVSARDGGDAMVVFSGRVSLVVKDDESKQTLTIAADEIIVNSDAGIMAARGDVVFERKTADGTDWFMGELLEVDLDDLSGVFLDGESRRSGGDSEDMLFRAEEIIRRGDTVLAFRNGTISTCAEEDPHYSIRASRIWILGGNEWAMADATLSVGEVPVLYLPFFYYPGEEIVFNPVFGYRDREGRFVQTTTYFVGDKPAKEESISLFKLTEGSGGYERRIDGVFLRTTNTKKKTTASDMVKLFADFYANLGLFAGVQARLAELGPFKSLELFGGLGVSRSVFLLNGSYTPFIAENEYKSEPNMLEYLGIPLPLRYAIEASGRYSAGPLSLSLSLPVYSDPYFDQDFRYRSENMEWLSFLSAEDDATAPGKRSTFVDKLDASLTVPSSGLPSWLSTLSIGSLDSSMTWSSKAMARGDMSLALYNATPFRYFFYPDAWTILDVSASLGGTLFKYPAPAAAATTAATPAAAVAATDNSLLGTLLADVPTSTAPWPPTPDKPAAVLPTAPGFEPPAVVTSEIPKTRVPLTMSLSWQASPTAVGTLKFWPDTWTSPDDVDWTVQYLTTVLRATGSLSGSADFYGGLANLGLKLSGIAQAQFRPTYLETSPQVNSWLKADAQYRSERLSASLSLRSTPFLDSWLWSTSSLTYSLDGTLYQTVYDSSNVAAGEYLYQGIRWSRDFIKSHSLGLTVAARPEGYMQTFALTASLPPLYQSYSGRLELKAEPGTLSFQTKRAERSDSTWDWDPLTTRLSVGKKPGPALTGTFVMDLDPLAPTSFSAGFSWDTFTADLAFRDAVAYALDLDTGWTEQGLKAFRPADLALGYTGTWAPDPAWKDRVTWNLGVTANARQSFLRFTDSSLGLTTRLTFKVHEFLDLSFSSTSRNSALWLYYPVLFEGYLPSGIDVEGVNPFYDIARGFFFWSPVDRKASLFKLKSLSFRATHYLHDWTLGMELTASPILNSAADPPSYEFKTTLTLSLTWGAVPEIKTSFKKDGETYTWDGTSYKADE